MRASILLLGLFVGCTVAMHTASHVDSDTPVEDHWEENDEADSKDYASYWRNNMKKGPAQKQFSRWEKQKKEGTREKYANMYYKSKLGNIPTCDAGKLESRYSPGKTSGSDTCDAADLCFAMQVLDQVRQDKSLPCKESEGAACQKSYYSAYKCKSTLVESQSPWDATGSRAGTKNTRGVMCTGNSPGMIAMVRGSKCGQRLVATRDYKTNKAHKLEREKLFQWITTEAGPAIWNPISKDGFCSVQRNFNGKNRPAKFALMDCSKVAPGVPAFSVGDTTKNLLEEVYEPQY